MSFKKNCHVGNYCHVRFVHVSLNFHNMSDVLPLPDPKKRQSLKTVWMLTYCPPGKYITVDMLQTHGIMADECHSTADRVMNYTYIHLIKKVRQTGIEAFLKKIKDLHGIIQSEIFGYDSVSSDSCDSDKITIHDHIVFKMLYNHCKERNPLFQACTDGEPVLKRGNLFAALDSVTGTTLSHHSMNRKQLLAHVASMEKMLQEAKAEAAENQTLVAVYLEVSQDRSRLRVENELLKRKLSPSGAAAQ